ncbi:MAG: acyl-CoA thioesterase II, partial [Actinobacteria bacterium]|nr:acyl-CoA thioesterase II [Actinomycetota bacterium]
MPNFSLDSLLDCMNVSEVREGVWSASNLDLAYYRIFGGQLLAQAVALGHATSPGKT